MPGETETNGAGSSDDQGAEHLRKLFLGGLTFQSTDEIVKEFYEKWGEVVECTVKKGKGYGFITFASASALNDAMENRPHVIDGKSIEPKRATPREMSKRPEANISVRKLYVSGVTEDHSEERFREHFSSYGNVQEVEIILDKQTGKPRGFAFVTFDDYDAVDKCVLQRSHMIEGKRCDVKKALSKEEMKNAEQKARERAERNDRSRGFGGRGGGQGGGYGGGRGGYGGGGGGGWGQQQQQYGGYGGGGEGYNQGYGGGGGSYGGYGGAQGGYGGGNQGWGAAGGGGWNQQNQMQGGYNQGGGGWGQQQGGGGGGWGGGGGGRRGY